MSDRDFVNKYLEDFSLLTKPNEEITKKIIAAKDVLIKTKLVITKL